MENEMLRRADEAIREDRVTWDDGLGNVLIDWAGIVRDVIGALREPTPEMVDAFMKAARHQTHLSASAKAAVRWNAMIDAALTPAKQPA